MLNPDFQRRQKHLLNALSSTAIAILPAANETIRNGDTPFPFRQNSDFYYLTGFDEPEAIAVFAPESEYGDYILFNRPRNKEREIWDGPRAGQEGAIKDFKADNAFPIEQFKDYLPRLLQNRTCIYYDLHTNNFRYDEILFESLKQLRREMRKGINAPDEFRSLRSIVHEMRLFKSDYEQNLMRYAGLISAQAHIRVMEVCKPGLYEYQLAAEMSYELMKNGCTGPAYPSIVGGGKNACVLHYNLNNAPLKAGDLVLVDAGGEYQNYGADITRTFPVNGKFTEEQALLYEIVLKAQKVGIAAAVSGNSWIKMQEAIVPIITAGLVELGILKGNVNDLIAEKAYLPFYMHNSGHWLGLDTHDAGRYKMNGNWRQLLPGMVLTVEPGIYIGNNLKNVAEKWWNIGIRIEDDILITPEGNEILSKAVPKEIQEIEALCAK